MSKIDKEYYKPKQIEILGILTIIFVSHIYHFVDDIYIVYQSCWHIDISYFSAFTYGDISRQFNHRVTLKRNFIGSDAIDSIENNVSNIQFVDGLAARYFLNIVFAKNKT